MMLARATPPPDLSVLIVSHGTRALLQDCLHSLFGGGLRGLSAEVIVVDNASRDGTVEMVCGEFPAVRLVTNRENVGFSRANNQALAVASGRNILLLNADTRVPEGTLARCVAFLEALPASAGAMTCRVVSPDGSLQHDCARRLPTPWSECCRALLLDRLLPGIDLFNRERFVGWGKADARPVPAILGAFMLIRRSAIEAVGGLDEGFFLMYEEVDLCKRLADAGYAIWYWPEAQIVHLRGQSTKQTPVMTYATSHLSALRYFAKHHPRAVKRLRMVMRLGMELKLLLLRLNALRRPADSYTLRHLEMALAARHALKTGQLVPEPGQVAGGSAAASTL